MVKLFHSNPQAVEIPHQGDAPYLWTTETASALLPDLEATDDGRTRHNRSDLLVHDDPFGLRGTNGN